MHFVLFKYLFTQKVLEIYGSLDALRTGDGWKGYMISEDIEPVMLVFLMICCVLCAMICYMAYKNNKEMKLYKVLMLLPIVSIIMMAIVQYVIEPGWVDALVQYKPV